jgi:CheY-like chemotaxis protein
LQSSDASLLGARRRLRPAGGRRSGRTRNDATAGSLRRKVVSAASARDALQALGRVPVDVLLADIAMPEQDGYELIREIRSARTGTTAAVPAAAVTAHARDDERQRALAAGFQMHLAKPIDPTTLARAVATLARLKRTA